MIFEPASTFSGTFRYLVFALVWLMTVIYRALEFFDTDVKFFRVCSCCSYTSFHYNFGQYRNYRKQPGSDIFRWISNRKTSARHSHIVLHFVAGWYDHRNQFSKSALSKNNWKPLCLFIFRAISHLIAIGWMEISSLLLICIEQVFLLWKTNSSITFYIVAF